MLNILCTPACVHMCNRCMSFQCSEKDNSWYRPLPKGPWTRIACTTIQSVHQRGAFNSKNAPTFARAILGADNAAIGSGSGHDGSSSLNLSRLDHLFWAAAMFVRFRCARSARRQVLLHVHQSACRGRAWFLLYTSMHPDLSRKTYCFSILWLVACMCHRLAACCD